MRIAPNRCRTPPTNAPGNPPTLPSVGFLEGAVSAIASIATPTTYEARSGPEPSRDAPVACHDAQPVYFGEVARVPGGLAVAAPLPLMLTDPVESLLPPDTPLFPPPLVEVLVPAADPLEPPLPAAPAVVPVAPPDPCPPADPPVPAVPPRVPCAIATAELQAITSAARRTFVFTMT